MISILGGKARTIEEHLLISRMLYPLLSTRSWCSKELKETVARGNRMGRKFRSRISSESPSASLKISAAMAKMWIWMWIPTKESWQNSNRILTILRIAVPRRSAFHKTRGWFCNKGQSMFTETMSMWGMEVMQMGQSRVIGGMAPVSSLFPSRWCHRVLFLTGQKSLRNSTILEIRMTYIAPIQLSLARSDLKCTWTINVINNTWKGRIIGRSMGWARTPRAAAPVAIIRVARRGRASIYQLISSRWARATARRQPSRFRTCRFLIESCTRRCSRVWIVAMKSIVRPRRMLGRRRLLRRPIATMPSNNAISFRLRRRWRRWRTRKPPTRTRICISRSWSCHQRLPMLRIT